MPIIFIIIVIVAIQITNNATFIIAFKKTLTITIYHAAVKLQGNIVIVIFDFMIFKH